MVKKSFYTLSQLNMELNKRINSVLREDVSDYVVNKLKDHINKDVYNSYSPKEYIRRKSDGGLLDDNNIRTKVVNQTLSVYEESEIEGPRLGGEKFKNKDGLAKLIEHGAYNPWDKNSYKWTKPRTFVTNTQKDINRNYKDIIKILKEKIEYND